MQSEHLFRTMFDWQKRKVWRGLRKQIPDSKTVN